MGHGFHGYVSHNQMVQVMPCIAFEAMHGGRNDWTALHWAAAEGASGVVCEVVEGESRSRASAGVCIGGTKTSWVIQVIYIKIPLIHCRLVSTKNGRSYLAWQVKNYLVYIYWWCWITGMPILALNCPFWRFLHCLHKLDWYLFWFVVSVLHVVAHFAWVWFKLCICICWIWCFADGLAIFNTRHPSTNWYIICFEDFEGTCFQAISHLW